MSTPQPQIRIQSSGMSPAFPVRFDATASVTAELIQQINEFDGVNVAMGNMRYGMVIRIGALFDGGAVINDVTRLMVEYFKWSPAAVTITLDGEPLSLS